MSDTPETDHAAFVLEDWRESYDVVLVSFAEQLERERDAVEQEVADVRDVLLDAMPHIGGSTKKLAELLVEERDEWKEVAEGNLLGAIHERDEARELAANLEVSLTASIRSANARQDETEHAMHECSELRILVDGLSEMTHELSEDRNLWKTEAEKWRDIAYGNRH